MEFNLESFLFGTAVGAAVLAMVRLTALKSLGLKLNQIGVELGIEGFEPEKKGSSIQLGDVSGQVGDIAGGNIDKSVSNFHKNLQNILQGAGHVPLHWQRTERLQVKSSNPSFVRSLEAIQTQCDDNWFERWVDACLSNNEIRSAISEKLGSLRSSGWRPVAMNFDNIQGGLHVNIEVRKDYRE